MFYSSEHRPNFIPRVVQQNKLWKQCCWYNYNLNITFNTVFWPPVSIRITYYITDQQRNAVRHVPCRHGQEKPRIKDLGVSWEILTRAVHTDITIRTQRRRRMKKDFCPNVYIDWWCTTEKKMRFADVWMNVLIELMASMDHVFQVHIHQRPHWSLSAQEEMKGATHFVLI